MLPTHLHPSLVVIHDAVNVRHVYVTIAVVIETVRTRIPRRASTSCGVHPVAVGIGHIRQPIPIIINPVRADIRSGGDTAHRGAHTAA